MSVLHITKTNSSLLANMTDQSNLHDKGIVSCNVMPISTLLSGTLRYQGPPVHRATTNFESTFTALIEARRSHLRAESNNAKHTV